MSFSFPALNRLNEHLKAVPPIALLLAIPVAQAALKLAKQDRKEIAKRGADLLRSATLLLPGVQKKYDEKIDAQRASFQKEVQKKWEKFGPPITELPEKGLSFPALCDLILRYKNGTAKVVEQQQFSGAIYSSSLNEKDLPILDPKELERLPLPEEESAQNCALLKRLYLLAFENSYLWNALHGKEFGAAQFIHYQLIQIIGRQFGAKPDEIAGFVTSGGTESLMTAAKGYVEWGVREKGLKREDCVIIAPDSIHASLDKAKVDFGFKLVKVPTDENGKVDLAEMRKIGARYKNRIVALFGSTPSYPKGKIDPIREMAHLAHEWGCGMHVDCCLGSLIVDMLDGIDREYLAIPYVTSLSADPHKNGLAAKGASILVTKAMPKGDNLAFYPIYSTPGWQGGIYGTPTKAGSQSAVPAFTALLALLKLGREGYRKMAYSIHHSALQLGDLLSRCDGLQVLGSVDANVVAFKIDPKMGYEKGAVYGFTHEMEKRGFTCSNIANEAAHFCVTNRFAADPTALKRFEQATRESMESLKELNRKKKEEKREFPGEAGIYGEIGAALFPKQEELSRAKFLENLLFGTQGAEDAVRSYFLAHSNPWMKGKKS